MNAPYNQNNVKTSISTRITNVNIDINIGVDLRIDTNIQVVTLLHPLPPSHPSTSNPVLRRGGGWKVEVGTGWRGEERGGGRRWRSGGAEGGGWGG